MASSRRTATNENISTYGDGTRNYTDVATWEAATDNDLVTATQSEILECYDDSDFTDRIGLAGATTSSSYFRIVRPADGEGHDGTPNNGVNFTQTTTISVFSSNEANSQMQDLIGTATSNDTSSENIAILRASAASGGLIGIIVDRPLNSGSGLLIGLRIGVSQTNYAVNCLVIDAESRNFENWDNSGYFYNCTSIDGDTGFLKTGGTMTCTNCLGYSGSTADFGAGVGGNYNSSSDGSAPGANSRTTQTFTFVASGSDDYHLASGDGGAKDFGTDLSGDGTYAFDDDIDGDTRSGSWDIGFDEFVAAGAEPIRPKLYQLLGVGV